MRPATAGASDDAGSGTVLVVGLVAVVASLAVALALLAQATVARHRAEAAADLAALAAADVLLGRAPGDACGRAERVAALNGARLVACRPAGDGSVVVDAVVTPGGAAGALGAARATARAGPAEEPP